MADERTGKRTDGQTGSFAVKKDLAQTRPDSKDAEGRRHHACPDLSGDVVTAEQAKIAEEAGACAGDVEVDGVCPGQGVSPLDGGTQGATARPVVARPVTRIAVPAVGGEVNVKVLCECTGAGRPHMTSPVTASRPTK